MSGLSASCAGLMKDASMALAGVARSVLRTGSPAPCSTRCPATAAYSGHSSGPGRPPLPLALAPDPAPARAASAPVFHVHKSNDTLSKATCSQHQDQALGTLLTLSLCGGRGKPGHGSPFHGIELTLEVVFELVHRLERVTVAVFFRAKRALPRELMIKESAV